MRKLLLCGMAAFWLTSGAAANAATLVFSDDFNSYNPQLAWDGSGVWVTGNSVDLVANNTFGLTCAGNTGNCVDLSGSSPGFTSKSFETATGTYLLEFDYTGNQLNTYSGQYPEAGFDVSLGSYTHFVGPLSNSSSIFQHFAAYVNVIGSPTQLSFNQVGGDNYRGSIIDNVTLQAVPEPGTWLTMILGFGILGGVLRRRKTAPGLRLRIA